MGDYILAPEMCVERKSLPDLRQSLVSGRLYQQATAMCAHYELPILLIEFERDKAFALQVPKLASDPLPSEGLRSSCGSKGWEGSGHKGAALKSCVVNMECSMDCI